MNLFEIDRAILECVDAETGEIMDIGRLQELQMERSAKIENVACYIKNLENDVMGLNAQKDAFAEREKAAKRKIESLKGYLVQSLQGEKFASERCLVSFRRSDKVEVEDVDLLPELYQTITTTISPDKNAIKEAIKAGTEIPGCTLVSSLNAQVK